MKSDYILIEYLLIQLIFSLKTPVGNGNVLLEWQTHDGSLWAITGSNRAVQVYDHFGNQKATINMTGYFLIQLINTAL